MTCYMLSGTLNTSHSPDDKHSVSRCRKLAPNNLLVYLMPMFYQRNILWHVILCCQTWKAMDLYGVLWWWVNARYLSRYICSVFYTV